jgi:hypothetical protein
MRPQRNCVYGQKKDTKICKYPGGGAMKIIEIPSAAPKVFRLLRVLDVYG